MPETQAVVEALKAEDADEAVPANTSAPGGSYCDCHLDFSFLN